MAIRSTGGTGKKLQRTTGLGATAVGSFTGFARIYTFAVGPTLVAYESGTASAAAGWYLELVTGSVLGISSSAPGDVAFGSSPAVGQAFAFAVTNGGSGTNILGYWAALSDLGTIQTATHSAGVSFTPGAITLLNDSFDDHGDFAIDEFAFFDNVVLTLDQIKKIWRQGRDLFRETPAAPLLRSHLWATGDLTDDSANNDQSAAPPWTIGGVLGSEYPMPIPYTASYTVKRPVLKKAGGTAFTAPLSESAISLSESAAVIFGAKPKPAETVTVTEAATGKFNAKVSLSEAAISLAESLLAKFGAHPALAETITLSEALAILFRAKAALAETAAVSEGIATGQNALTAALSETVAVTEAIAAKFRAKAALVETAVAVEAIVAKLANRLTLAETIALSEALTATKTTRAQLSETVSVADNALSVRRATTTLLEEFVAFNETSVGSKGNHVALSEAASLTESLVARFKAHPILAETVALAENIAARFVTHVTLVETAALSEALVGKLGAKAALAETIALTEAVAAKFRAKAALGETVSVGEQINTGQIAYTVTLAETVTVTEGLATIARLKLTLSETAALAEAVTGKLGAKGAVAETVLVLEALTTRRATAALLSESAPLTDALAVRQGVHAPLVEAVVVSDAVGVIFHPRAALAETAQVTESINTGNQAFSLVLFETVPVSEEIAAGQRLSAPLAESVVLADAIATRLAARAALTEAVVLAESVSTGGAILYQLRRRLEGVVVDGTGALERQLQRVLWPLQDDGRLELALVRQDGSAYNLAGATLRLAIARAGGAPLVHVTATITAPSAGTASFALSQATMSVLVPNFDYLYDVQLTDAEGKRHQVVPASTWRALHFRP